MTAAYAPDSWDGFALAVVTAAATLTGLLFVAVSINLQRILSFPNLPPRVGQTLILFSTPLFSGLLLVIPGQGRTPVAAELLVAGILFGAGLIRIDARTPPSANTNRLTWLVSGFFPAAVSCGCLVVAASASRPAAAAPSPSTGGCTPGPGSPPGSSRSSSAPAPGFRRTWLRRTPGDVAAAGLRLGAAPPKFGRDRRG